MRRKAGASLFRQIYDQPYSDEMRVQLYNSTKRSKDMLQRLNLLQNLPVHNGCVNSLCWSESGQYILSGSDDQHLVITDAYNYNVISDYKTSHRANIFSAKFLPNSSNHHIISCSGDGIILYTDLLCKDESLYNQFNCHSGTTYEVITVPNDPHTFLSCGEDGTVRWFDLRVKSNCNKPQCKEDVMITCQRAVTALSVNPVVPYQLAIGCSDSTVRMFDRRMLGTKASGWSEQNGALRPLCSFTVPQFEDRSYRITSLCFSPEGEDILVSYSSDHLYLFSVKDQNGMTLQSKAEDRMCVDKAKKMSPRTPPPVRRLRLRGDWSDTGPNARPERESGRHEVARVRPTLHATLMQRMTDVLARMLNDPATRAALSGGGEDSVEGDIEAHAAQQTAQEVEGSSVVGDEGPDEDATREAGDGVEEEIAVAPVPQLSSLTIATEERELHHSGDEGVSSGPRPDPEGAPSTTPSASEEAAGESHTSLPNTSANEASSSTMIDQNITNLQDQLSNMRDEFLERHGSEPTVSLVYSDKGSTSATISLGVGDEVSRDLHPNSSNATADVEDSNGNVMAVDEATPVSAEPSQQERPDQAREDDVETYDSDDEVDYVSPSMEYRPVRVSYPALDESRHDKEVVFDEQWVNQPAIKQKYTGHRNARTMIKEATFWGENYVLSGSDCGHVFAWDRLSGELVMLLEADRHVVNCLQPHPFLPILATSGIDYDVKLWAPLAEEPRFDAQEAEVLMKRNEVMLEETKDTITVPASFMIRMLACLNQIRRGGRILARRRQQGGEGSSGN